MIEFDERSVVDLDHVAPPRAPEADNAGAAPRSRPRRQCPYCFTNRSSIFYWESKGCEDRALQALRLAHPEEFDEFLQREREAADAATAKAWERHLANQCDRAGGRHASRYDVR